MKFYKKHEITKTFENLNLCINKLIEYNENIKDLYIKGTIKNYISGIKSCLSLLKKQLKKKNKYFKEKNKNNY